MSLMPTFYFDHPFADVYSDLVDGRAIVTGPESGHGDAVAVIAGAKVQWNASMFETVPNCKVISRVGVGYDNVNVADATAAGIVVCNTPTGPMVSTAEHTVALMLALGRELPEQTQRSREGLPGSGVGTAMEFDQRTIGLIGYGRIARRVAVVAKALGMRVLAHDPYVSTDDDVVELVSLHELLASSDVISLHAPGTAETAHLINASTISAMRAGVLIVNCARGGLVDQEALLAGLESGQVGGAALDVTTPEPLPVGHPLLVHPRVIVTPHIASATVAGRRRLYEMAIANAFNLLSGQPASTVTA